MKHQFIVLSILCYILKTTDGRNLDKPETDSKLNDISSTKRVDNRLEGHSRHRRQYNYAYRQNNNALIGSSELNNYLRDMTSSFRVMAESLKHLTNNQNDRFNNDRRDNNYNSEKSINKILAIVEELAIRARNPPSPPPPPTIQVLYVPYPISENGVGQRKENVTIDSRILKTDDPKRICPTPPSVIKPDSEEEDDDGSRPVSFKPVPPKRPINKPPPFEHGTNQEGIPTTTPVSVTKPTKCDMAVLLCCGLRNSERKECFYGYECSSTFGIEKACHPLVINKIKEKIAKLYGPINDF